MNNVLKISWVPKVLHIFIDFKVGFKTFGIPVNLLSRFFSPCLTHLLGSGV